MKIAIYPGSYDPITNGHLDIIERSSKLFDKIIVAVARNAEKGSALFSESERITMINKSITHLKNIEVDLFEGLLVNYAAEKNANAIIRGLRALSDFEFEFKMALMNRSLKEEISTVFMMPHEKYTHISSSLVKEVASLGGDVSAYVPQHVEDALKESFSGK
ncbi:MAG: pantetheine-phosphate adenylyltransferase [Candidatus Marinimicrobia bacterium]|nr:pantetheine-phosphate adenylyltransferase [Candidatus Neomarinimicrobiota bacterium]MBT7377145.1 pantetheine-phosphate adenylyltransferase [Candidatus Neomarinimicrobiota bacterium]